MPPLTHTVNKAEATKQIFTHKKGFWDIATKDPEMAPVTSVAFADAGSSSSAARRNNVQPLAQIPNDDTKPSNASLHMPLDIGGQQWLAANGRGGGRSQESQEQSMKGERPEVASQTEAGTLGPLITSASVLLRKYIRRYADADDDLSMEDAEIRALVQDFREQRALLTLEGDADAESTVILLPIDDGSRNDPQQRDVGLGHFAFLLANCAEMIIKLKLEAKKPEEREKTVAVLDKFVHAFPASFANDGDIDRTWKLTLEMRTQLVVQRAMLDRGPASQKRDITNEVMSNLYGYSSHFHKDLEDHLVERQKQLNKATTRMTDAHFDTSALQLALFHFAQFVNMAYNPLADNDKVEDEEALAIRQVSSTPAELWKRPSIMDRQADAVRIGFDPDLSPRSAIPRKRLDSEIGTAASPRVAQILRTGHTAIQPNLEQLSSTELPTGEVLNASGTTSIAAPVMPEDDFYEVIQKSAKTAIAQQHNISVDSLSNTYNGHLSMPSVHGPLPIRKAPTAHDPQPNSRPYAPRKRNAYTKEQEEALIKAVAKCGTKWNQIKIEFGGPGRPLYNIDPRQLKDKARIIKLAHLKSGQPLPAGFDRVTGTLPANYRVGNFL